MKKNVRCAVIGQHPLRFPWGFDEEDDGCRRMKLEMAQRIMELRQRGVTEFQVACDPGVGLYAAEIINTLRENDQALRLICALPHEGQATKWTPQLRDRYFNMLASCTDIICIALHEQPDAQFSAYQQIIKQSEVLMTFQWQCRRQGRGLCPCAGEADSGDSPSNTESPLGQYAGKRN